MRTRGVTALPRRARRRAEARAAVVDAHSTMDCTAAATSRSDAHYTDGYVDGVVDAVAQLAGCGQPFGDGDCGVALLLLGARRVLEERTTVDLTRVVEGSVWTG